MASACRKRKRPEREAPPLCGEALARAILALPPPPQTVCCRVPGCQEPLTPGYHKKYRICLAHSCADELRVDGKTRCRWCQQCGSFHSLEEFDANYRSCRRSLARHQERRKQRNALLGTRSKKSKQAQAQQRSEQQQSHSQLGEDGDVAELQPQLPSPLQPLPLPVQPAQPGQVAASTPPRKPADKPSWLQTACKQPDGSTRQGTAASSAQPSVEEPSQAEQSPSDVHSSQRSQPLPPAAPPPAASVQLASPASVMQPVTPPGQPSSHTARSLPVPLAQPPPAWASMCVPSIGPAAAAPPPQRALWQLVQPAPAAPAAPAGWCQQAPDRGWLLIVGDQRQASAPPQLPPQQALLPTASCDLQQLGGQAVWLLQQAHQDGSSGGGGGGASGGGVASGGGGGSSTAYYPCYEPGMVQGLLPVHSSAALEPHAPRQLADAAACSASTAATPLSPRMANAAPSLQPCGSGVGTTYMAVAQLPPYCGGSCSAGEPSPFYGASTAGMPGSPAVWLTASLPAGPVLLPSGLPLDGCHCSSNCLSQAWGQLGRQGHEQMALLVASSPRDVAQPSPRTTLQPSQPPSWLPSLPPLRAPLGGQQAWQQQPGWQGEWADEALLTSQPSALLTSQPSRAQSPAVSWLNGF